MSNTAVITGANRGIGLEFAKLYSSLGYKVYGLCRTPSEALQALDVNLITDIDVSSASVGETLADALSGVAIDLLINNAGILHDEQLGSIDYSSVSRQFEVNSLGPLRVTEALESQLTKGAKVALITSRMGSITDNTSGGRYGYRMSKAALNAAAMSLARDLKPKGVAVAILHPGFVKTEMVGGQGDISPEVAASRLAARIDATDLSNTGTFWHSNGEVLPW